MTYPNIIKGFNHFLHGGDYNPDQWLNYPDVIEEDFKLMKLSGCNTFSIGIFAWSTLEPEEGKFNFEWLDKIMDKMAANNFNVFLATPTGAKPPWMAEKYPEIKRVSKEGIRDYYHTRHNHCWTSPIYREKAKIIISKLAERYKTHPALKGWHISNEYNGQCYCELCLKSWQNWLKNKYKTIEKFNDAMWTNFWSHGYNDWSQIEPRDYVDGIRLDWLRFTTWQLCDFMSFERQIIKSITPNIPVTTNFMGFFPTIDYWKVSELCDFIADDSYPSWYDPDDNSNTAAYLAMKNDMLRTLKNGKPYIYMESSPSATNWQDYHRLKRPNVHKTEMLQAIAHGADGTMYFQWRKGKGGCEKYHGAVVDHAWGENTRVFKEVTEISEIQGKIEEILGSSQSPEIALIYDWEIKWAIETSNISKTDKNYLNNCLKHYKIFWQKTTPTDVINSNCDFSKYKLIVAPMLYMLKPLVAERLIKFTENGGTVVLTHLSGYVDEYNRCFTGEKPGDGLRKLLGFRNEEFDELTPNDSQTIQFLPNNPLFINGKYKTSGICEIIHCETAKPIAKFSEQFYKGSPSVTINKLGKGNAIYIACNPEDIALEQIYLSLTKKLKINSILGTSKIPKGISIVERKNDNNSFIFILNFKNKKQKVKIGNQTYIDMINNKKVKDTIEIGPFDSIILKK